MRQLQRKKVPIVGNRARIDIPKDHKESLKIIKNLLLTSFLKIHGRPACY